MLRATPTAARAAAAPLRSPAPVLPTQPRRTFSVTVPLRQPVKTMKMADVGEGIKEVEVLNWEVKEGDVVDEFQKLCDMQSDKATVEITSKYAGKIVKIYTAQGDMQQVGAALIDIDADGGADEPAPAAPAAAAPAAAKASSGPVVATMKMADVGEGIKEVEVLSWEIKEGDTVDEFQKLCDMQSDKATVEITSKYAGKVVKIYTAQGSMQQVGQPLVDILTEDAGGDAPAAPAATTAAPAAAAASSGRSAAPAGGASISGSKKALTSPMIRAQARADGVDLSLVKGTGDSGRITKEDYAKYLAAGKPGAGAPAGAPAAAAAAAGAAPVTGGPVWSPEDRTIKVTGITKAMVKSMEASLSIPTFSASDEVNLNNLVDARAALKPVAAAKGVKLSYMPFFIKAASLALRQFPMINASINKDSTEITYKGAHNIGVAMDTPQGLIVPNIKDIQSKSILQIAADLNALQERGSSGKLTGDDLKGCTFTLSNIGAIGGTIVSPIIFPPNVAIGALGKLVKLPKYDAGGNVVPVNTLYITWTADHRVIDGATMVRFSNAWKAYLENPTAMLLETA